MFVKSTLSTTLDFTNFVTRDALFVRSENFPIENIQLDKTVILNVDKTVFAKSVQNNVLQKNKLQKNTQIYERNTNLK